MKKFKKLLAFGLALIMCLGMAVTASAATGKITVQGANDGEYKAYKIFDGTIVGDKNMSYTTTTTNDAFMKAQAGITEGKTSGEIKDGDTVLFTVVDNGDATYVNVEDAQKAAAWVQLNITSLIGETPAATADAAHKSVTLEGLDFGYYYVISGTETYGSAVMLTSVNGDVTINEKHGTSGFGDDDKAGKHVVDEDGNILEDKTVEIGQEITYQINYTNALNYVNGKLITKYTIKDDLNTGIELVAGSLKVFVNEEEIMFTNTSENGGIEGEIEWATPNTDGDRSHDVLLYPGQPSAPSTITVEYKVTVTEEFEAGDEGVENTVTIGYETEDGGTDTDTDTETVYTGTATVTKVDGSDNKPLSGAIFAVRNEKGEYMTRTEDNGKVTIGWDSNVDHAYKLATTDDNDATIEFKGLKAGRYELVEIKAPDGYNLLPDGIEFTLGAPGTTKEDGEGNSVLLSMAYEENVANNKGTLLPSTGGIGTTIFYVVGGILVAGAGVLLITKKRMKKEQ